MSMSREERIQNMNEALTLMFNEVGDQYFGRVHINTGDDRYENIQATTWKELADRYYIQPIGYGMVIFTGYGWRTCVMSSKLHESEEFKQKLGKLSAALKNSVKGRQYPATLGAHDLGNETGLGWEFVRNAIQGELIQHVFGIKGATGSDDTVVIQVPIDYGDRPL